MKIVVLDAILAGYGGISWEELERLGELTVYDLTAREQVVERIANAEIVLVNRCRITKEVLAQCPNLRYVGTLGTGFNGIDIEETKKRGIVVCNAPAYASYAVAQATIALLLEITNQVAQYNRYVAKGGWKMETDEEMLAIQTTELFGKTMGLVGMGDIGGQVAKIAIALGMKVLATRRNLPAGPQDGITYTTMDDLLAQSDVVSIHCPLNAQTRGMMDTQRFAQMRMGSILLNTARGAIVDESALLQALHMGRIAYAGLDVMEQEPPKVDNPLLAHPHCIITPHIAWMPQETRERLVRLCTKNVEAFLHGTPINVVNL